MVVTFMRQESSITTWSITQMTLIGLNSHCMKLSGLKISWFYFLSLPSFLSGEYSRRIGRSSVLQECFLSCSNILLRTYIYTYIYIYPTVPLLLLQIETSFIIPYIYYITVPVYLHICTKIISDRKRILGWRILQIAANHFPWQLGYHIFDKFMPV